MTTRSEREKQKENEQHQAALERLLKEEDNRLCADCGAKGPRWASWSLGVFICIRCAGIHRNLGVHISRVKSVNLDQWTPEQIQSMLSMGNGRARLVFEADVPEDFRRPQSDQAVEVFIRDKYERKKFYNKEALPKISSEAPASPSDDKTKAEKERRKDEKKEEKKEEKRREKESDKNSSKVIPRSPKKSPENHKEEKDLLGPDVVPSSVSQAGGETAPSAGGETAPSGGAAAVKPEEQKPKKKLMSKDSILSLYGVTGGGGGLQMSNGAMTTGQGGAMTTGQGGAMTTGQGGATVDVNQVSQQISSMSVDSTAPPSGQTLSTQLWK